MKHETSGVKRRLADLQAREIPRDKRFCRGFGLEMMRDLRPSLTVYLFPTHFKLEHFPEGFSYHGPMKSFITAIERQELVPEIMDLLEEFNCPFYDGKQKSIIALNPV
jgi:hypothetical protein